MQHAHEYHVLLFYLFFVFGSGRFEAFPVKIKLMQCVCLFSGTYYCEYCLRIFSSQKGVSRHLKYSCTVLEPSAPPLKCPHCIYVCRRPDNMKNHVASHHSAMFLKSAKSNFKDFDFSDTFVLTDLGRGDTFHTQ